MKRYLVQAWDKGNRRWDDGGADILDCIVPSKRKATALITELSRGWECPRKELRYVQLNAPSDLEYYTGIKSLVGDDKYESIFKRGK